ncbi:MAG: hypothetical protein QG614_282 [Patescibacteria group bacterium]|nr:hypothetical protein [Patescibacteria group bacterium]
MRYFLLTLLFLWIVWIFWYGVGGPLHESRKYPYVDMYGNYYDANSISSDFDIMSPTSTDATATTTY